MDLYEQIREQHIQDYGSKFEEWAPRILVDQYSDRTHFIFELIQNAEDAGATCLTFSLYPDRLMLCHNGKPFTESDIRGICGIRSTKDEPDSGKIGRFGIGFKSVYAYTKTPAIYSGNYSFMIHNLILPYGETNIYTGNDTILILPFDGKVEPEESYTDIKKALEEYITSDSLFALQNVKSISCKVFPDEVEWSVSKECNPIDEIVDSVVLTEKPSGEKKELLVFHTNDKQPILIGFSLDDSDSEKQIVKAKQHYLYVFFPTAVESHLSFYVHVPFSTTPARDNVRHNEVNRLLAEKLNQLFAESIKWLLDNHFVTLKFLNDIYPIDDTCKEENLQGIYRTGIKLLNDGMRLLPTSEGEYCSVSEALLPYTKVVAENITQPILRSEFGDDVCWIHPDISTEANARLRYYLTRLFNIKVLRWRDVLSPLSAEVLEQQTDEWLVHFLDAIYAPCTSVYKDKVDARTIPLVRLQDGTHICSVYGGVAQVYINNPISCKRKIKDTILANQRAHDFYVDALGIEIYDAIQELKDDVVSFYGEDPEDTDIPFEDNLEHFIVIQRALKENESVTRRILKDVPIVLSSAGWQTPDKCYLPDSMANRTPQENELLSSLDLQWVSDQYLGKVSPEIFLKIGCNNFLKPVQVDRDTYYERFSQYDSNFFIKAKEQIFSKPYTEIVEPADWNYANTVDNIDSLLVNITLDKSILIVDFLNEFVTNHPLYGTMRGARDRNYTGKYVSTLANIPSELAIDLESYGWLFNQNGELVLAEQAKKSELHSAYNGHGKNLFSQLRFVQENAAVEAAIQSVDAPYQNFVSTMLNSPEELRWMFEAYQKFQQKKTKKSAATHSVLDILKSQSSVDTTVLAEDTPDDDTLGEYGAVQNLKRRATKLDESFQEGLAGVKSITPRLRYTCQESNAEEKAFLASQYYGKCQICGKQIIRSNGKPYFEACNILPTREISIDFKQRLSEGWNSLCLCPNCAAEFKYGKKNLSQLISMIENYKIKEGDENLIDCNIEMQGEPRTIKYTAKHFLALQRAVEFYESLE